MPPLNEIWNRIIAHAGETFYTITGLEFTYDIREDKFYPSRTNFGIAKSDFETAYQYVPIERPSLINWVVRGPSYIWAVLHDQRISEGRW